MPNYSYIALNEQSQSVTGTVDAAGRGEAIASLAGQKLFVTELSTGSKKNPGEQPASLALSWRAKVKPRARAVMLRQIATALKA